MPKVTCYNCEKPTPVIPPRYRCKFCNYPLKKQLTEEESLPEPPNISSESSSSGDQIQSFMPKPKPARPIKSVGQGVVAGWLIVHTENKAHQTYELKEGENIIGRSDKSHQVAIEIIDDFVSRTHATITVRKDFLHRFQYVLVDGSSQVGSKASTNGVYINGHEERLPKTQVIYLRDGDTIQVGLTKLIFKNTDMAFDIDSAASSVINTAFTNTVDFRR